MCASELCDERVERLLSSDFPAARMAARASSSSAEEMAAITALACDAAWRAPSQLTMSVFAASESDGIFFTTAA